MFSATSLLVQGLCKLAASQVIKSTLQAT